MTSTPFAPEPLERRCLLSCLPQPFFDADEGEWIVHHEGFGPLVTAMEQEDFDLHQRTTDHRGLLDASPESSFLSSLLAEDTVTSRIGDLLIAESFYDFSFVRITAIDLDETGVPTEIELAASRWKGFEERTFDIGSEQDLESVRRFTFEEHFTLVMQGVDLDGRPGIDAWVFANGDDAFGAMLDYRMTATLDEITFNGGDESRETYDVEFGTGDVGPVRVDLVSTRFTPGASDDLDALADDIGHDLWTGDLGGFVEIFEAVEDPELLGVLSSTVNASFTVCDDAFLPPVVESSVGGLSSVLGGLNVIVVTEGGVRILERGDDPADQRLIDLDVDGAFDADTWIEDGEGAYVVLTPDAVHVGTSSELVNLTEVLDGVAIAAHLTVFESLEGRVFLAGMNDLGEFVAYIEQDGTWSYRNISVEDLAPQGLETPTFTGTIASYVTSWNGLNVAGIDESGDIRSIWWAPGLDRWTASNLSVITGAPTSTGNLAVTLTSWGGINLAATSDDGRLRVTWWVPSFGGEWMVSDLTADAGDVDIRIMASTLFSYVTPWGGMTLGGLDEAGDLSVFWWAPGEASWAPATLADSSVSPRSDLRSIVASDGETSVIGESTDGDIVRLWWRPGNAAWSTEVLPL